ncbi:MAG: M13 family metallopeptidase [Alphaproteobacteria bacterium]|nr:M13 family metallopeptidase [Alphaproteobacteria bacterium]MCL2758435.1 M13 family metallopeptidase [Alphaproteobacteria bacterium]
MKYKKLNIIAAALVVLAAAFAIFTRGREMTSGIDLKNMDLSVRPGDDFYDFATAGWRANNPVPDDFPMYGIFQKLTRENNLKIKALVTEIARRNHAHGTNEQRIATFFNVAMDEEKLNADGITPVADDFAKIARVQSRDELPALLGYLHRFINPFWADGVMPDMKDSSTYIYAIGQAGLGMPEREYYFAKDSENIRAAYKEYLSRLFSHFKIDPSPDGAEASAKAVYNIEKRLAGAFHTKEVMRNPHKNYHRFAVAEFKKEFPGFDWDAYFAARGAAPTVMNVGQPAALREAIKIMQTAELSDIKNYIKRVLADAAASHIDDDAFMISFDFYRRAVAGQITPKPRWERVLGVMDSSIGEALGQAYVARYFPPEAKARMEKLVENLREAFREHIVRADWMSDETKAAALEKLSTFRAKIGYPDRFRDYSGLEILSDSHWANVRRAAIFEDEFWLTKIETPVDRDLWHMTPQTVNAYYWSQTNEICFPAGILQPPFFDMNADDAANYGAIGAVIAHEMTHGFDDAGRKFDADGNMRDWWKPADAAAFNARAQVIRKFFDSIEVMPGVFANGEFSLGEALADLGGVVLSYTAFRNATRDAPLPMRDGFTPEQRFFIAYATVWAANIRDEEILRRVKTTPHPLPRWRTNGILPHVDAWHDAFDVRPGDRLYLPHSSRVRIW